MSLRQIMGFRRVIGVISVISVCIVRPAAGQVTLATGPSEAANGYLRVNLDDYGSFDFFGPSGEDRFNPSGVLAAESPTFTSGMFVFVNSGRELLSDSAQWQNTGPTATGPNFAADASLNRTVTSAGVASDTDGDGVNDAVTSSFEVTGINNTNLAFRLEQRVFRSAPGVAAVLKQRYTITNNGGPGVTDAKLVRAHDGDLGWPSTGNFFFDDEVGTQTNGLPGDPFVYMQNPSNPGITAITLSSPNAVAYYGGKSGVDPPPSGGPAFGFGTDVQVWDAAGIPQDWTNYIAGVGHNTNGNSGPSPPGANAQPDGFIGLGFSLEMGQGSTTSITICHTYGSTTPVPCPSGGVWQEVGDAFQGIPSHQNTVGEGELVEIRGRLNRPAGDHVDTYAIHISNPAEFYASTSGHLGGSTPTASELLNNTRLWLHSTNSVATDGDTMFLMGNDNDAFHPGDLASTISDPTEFNSLTNGNPDPAFMCGPSTCLQPGLYLLSISTAPNDPEDAQFRDLALLEPNLTDLHAPNPAAGPFDHWENGADSDVFNYVIALRGARFVLQGFQPGDFNYDYVFNCADVDALVNVIAGGTNDPNFDLNFDAQVDQADLTEWLRVAGMNNLESGNSYIRGDANLDGNVDGSDFGIWNSNKFTANTAWCRGNFNADNNIDGSDFGIWNANKFTSALAAKSVPEPSVISVTVLAIGVLLHRFGRVVATT